MRKFMTAAFLVALLASLCFAQDDDYHKLEVSAGYSSMTADGILGDGELFADDPEEAPEDDGSVTLPSPFFNGNNDNLFSASPVVNRSERRRPRLGGFNASVTYNLSKFVGIKFELSGHRRSGDVNTSYIFTIAPFNPANNTLLPIQASYPPGTFRALVLFPSSAGRLRQRHYNYLGGVQFKNNSKEKRFKPFAHALAGVSRQTVEFEDFGQRELALFGGDKFTNTGFTMALGGGIDVRLSKRIDLRVLQVDYNPVRIKDQTVLAFRQPITNAGLANTVAFANASTSTLYSQNEVTIRGRWQNNFRLGVGIVFH